jgi:hypothetical protein
MSETWRQLRHERVQLKRQQRKGRTVRGAARRQRRRGMPGATA